MTTRLVDIAEKAGVSASAVSRVLRNPGKKIDISQDARDRIVRIARELNYRPHAGARSMKNKKFDAVGVLANPIGGCDGALIQLLPYHRALIQQLSNHQLNVIIMSTGGDTLPEQDIPSQMTDRRFDGLVVTVDVNEKLEQAINALDIPILWLNSQKRRGMNTICPDDRMLGYLNALALLAIGHRKIAVCNASQCQSFDQHRLEGFCHAHKQFGITPDVTVKQNVQRHEHTQQFKTLMAQQDDPYTAYVGMNPMISECLGAYMLRQRCFPGQDMALVSMDRGEWEYLYPCISGMQVPGVTLGHVAADRFDSIIKKRRAGKNHFDIAPQWHGGETLIPGNDSHEARVLCEELMNPDADILKVLKHWIDPNWIIQDTAQHR
ncbi:MAG: LacI family DNA-binding transcriptional regulator [Phycisphaeraceae bacterium JB051]